jgi:hypothetical protein
MNPKSLRKAVDLGKDLQHVFVSTSDKAGLPHVAAAWRIEQLSDERVSISAWFCPGTLSNIQQNKRIALVVWEPLSDKGFQILGEVEDVVEESVMDGYAAKLESLHPLPQVESKFIVKVEKVLQFSNAPHSDSEG